MKKKVMLFFSYLFFIWIDKLYPTDIKIYGYTFYGFWISVHNFLFSPIRVSLFSDCILLSPKRRIGSIESICKELKKLSISKTSLISSDSYFLDVYLFLMI